MARSFFSCGAQGRAVRGAEQGNPLASLQCGSAIAGVTAAAIAATFNETGTFKTAIETLGGHLEVSFKKPTPVSAIDVVLTGPAAFVFKGEIAI